MNELPCDLDAVLLFSFGGPEGPDDVIPFLENVTRGRGIPRERLAAVGEHYAMFGGVSPINQHNRDLLEALREEFDAADLDLPLYWGNRNWHPMVADTLRDMTRDGHRRILAIVTSAFGSYSGCRQYSEDLESAAADLGAEVHISKARLYWNHPGFVEAMTDRIEQALGQLTAGERAGARLVFTAHSIPTAWIDTSPYESQLRAAAAHLAAVAAPDLDWDLAFQSRSGPPSVPWLEPDIVDHLQALGATAIEAVVVVPLGFVSDHMEVVYDLDTEAAAAAKSLGIRMVRAGTAGTHPAFVGALRQLVQEHITAAGPLSAIGEPWPNPCPAGCCDRPARP